MHRESAELAAHDYERADTRLQDYMDRSISMSCDSKHIVTIATSRPQEEDGEPTEQNDVEGGAKPDAWIFDKDNQAYCLLFECKRGGNPVAKDQVLRHAKEWFGMTPAKAEGRTVSLTWQDVLRAKEITLAMQPELNEQERLVLEALEEFLGFFGYRLFKGFKFAKLQAPSGWRLSSREARHGPFRFDELRPAPRFRLCHARDGHQNEAGLFRFDRLDPVPAFSLLNKKGDKHGR
jgi:hypothetical protein